jgi:biotin transport system substrate-specific component
MSTIYNKVVDIRYFSCYLSIMKTKDLTMISLFIALMIAGAFIRIPLPFIEVTFQAFFAVLAGLMLGAKKGFIATLLYMIIGLIGLPVFSRGGGIAYVLIPSFGFILGFLPASFISGYLYKSKGVNKYIAALLGMLVIYLIGTPYMFLILRFYSKSPIAFSALSISFIPYFIKDLLLGVMGAYILKYIKI